MYNLKGLRKEVNKTQSEIAVLFGCKQNNISMQEKSDRDLTTEQMDVLRKNFGEEIVIFNKKGKHSFEELAKKIDDYLGDELSAFI